MKRDHWLDTVRALAILSVLTYHCVQMAPESMRPAWLFAISRHGHYGVDLFFVLSGWLIGGLYWRELRERGGVDLWRFWQRRWLRTVPPYFVALLASWGAVAVMRGDAFDWGYLAFLQNYTGVRYFAVSWSLCVEEHFYLAAPLVALASARFRISPIATLLALVPLAIAARWVHYEPTGTPIAYVTETHLKWDGLVLGFAAAGMPINAKRSTLAIAGACLAAVAAVLDGRVGYALEPSLVAGAGVCLILVGVGAQVRSNRAIGHLASATYSVYLTHALMIHVAVVAAGKLGAWAYYPVAAAVIAAASTAFYRLVERPAIRLRDVATGHAVSRAYLAPR